MNNITHSKLLNDFLSFYVESFVNGEKRYESVVDYFNKVIYISDLTSLSEYDFLFSFKDESNVEKLIRSEVEKIIQNNLKGYKTILFEGSNFSTLDGFYDEVNKKLVNSEWGRNLDAFNDILRGGFGTREYGESFRLIWTNSEKSRKDLSYKETVQILEKRLQNCHPSNISSIEEELINAKNSNGPTAFDWLVEIIKEHDHITFELN